MKFESLPQGVRLAVEAAQEKKAAGITVLDLTAAGAFTDFFVVCTGFSTPQVQAICTEIEAQLYKNLSRSPEHREGRNVPDSRFGHEHFSGEAASGRPQSGRSRQ